jgi:hypothetical protein
MTIKEKEEALVKLIGRSALESSIECDMDLYHWDRDGAIEMSALRHDIIENPLIKKLNPAWNKPDYVKPSFPAWNKES